MSVYSLAHKLIVNRQGRQFKFYFRKKKQKIIYGGASPAIGRQYSFLMILFRIIPVSMKREVLFQARV